MERKFEKSHLANHLTDEQFADLLLGANPAAVQAHLKACSACAEEADRVAGAIGSFEQQQTRLWAERRAATSPMLTPAPGSRIHLDASPSRPGPQRLSPSRLLQGSALRRGTITLRLRGHRSRRFNPRQSFRRPR